MTHFEIKIVLVYLGTPLDFLELDNDLILLFTLCVLLHVVLVLTVIKYLADGWFYIRCNFNQVEAL